MSKETSDEGSAAAIAATTPPESNRLTAPAGERGGAGPVAARQARPPEDLSAAELVKEVTGQIGLLARKQIDLATSELRADLKAELQMVGGLGIGAILAILGLAILLVAGVFGLALLMPAWQAALIVGAGLLLVAGIVAATGWSRRAKSPLHRTRQTLKEDLQWSKEKLA